MPKTVAEVTVRELKDLALTFTYHIQERLGFDYTSVSKAHFMTYDECLKITLTGWDKFQRSVEYKETYGHLGYVQYYPIETPWEEVIAETWQFLEKKVMSRAERELRFTIGQLSKQVENTKDMQTEVGKLAALRILGVRDELGEKLLTYVGEEIPTPKPDEEPPVTEDDEIPF